MAFSYSTAYMQSEPLSTEKQKEDKKYFEDQGNYFIMLLVRDNSYINTARNYYSSKRDLLDFQYLEDVYGMQNPIDLSFTNIIKPRVDALVGLSLLTEPSFSIKYTDKDTIQAGEQERVAAFIDDLEKNIKDSVGRYREPTKEAKNDKSEKPQEKLFRTKLNEKYGDTFMSSYIIAAQHVLELIQSDPDIDLSDVKKKVSKDYFITGQAYTRDIYLGPGKNPKIERIMPENLYSNRPRIDTDLKRADAVVHKRMLRPHQIIKEFGDKLNKEDAVKLFGRAYAATGSTMDLSIGPRDSNLMDEWEPGEQMDSLYMSTGYSNGGVTPEGAIYPVYHVEWLASTQIDDGRGGKVYREDRYEVYRIGPDIYLGGRRCDEAPRRRDEPWKTRLSYTGIINHPGNGHIVSLVLQMKELQDLYDIIMFFRNNLIATSGVSGSRVNVAAIPKALGNKFMNRLTKWLTLRKQGVELVDPTEDGAALFQHYGDFNASVDGNALQGIDVVLTSLALQADIISGVPKQMLGIIEERDAVENVRAGMNQVSVLSLEMFRDVDRMLAQTMQQTLDTFKYSYKDKKIVGIKRNGIAMIPFSVDPSKFSLSDHDIAVISAGIENSKLMKIQQLSKELMGGGAVDPDVVIKLVNAKSVVQAEFMLTQAVAKKKEETANLEQMQQQMEEASNTIKQLEAEIKRLENNAQQLEQAKLEALVENNEANVAVMNRRIAVDDSRNKEEHKIRRQEVELKKDVVELERAQILYGEGNAKEVNNNKT